MRKFQFRLERVLAWRGTELQLEEHRLKTLSAEMEELEAARARLMLERTLAEREVLARREIEGSELSAHAGYLAGLLRDERRLAGRRREQEAKIAAQHERVLEARRRCRLLERLRGRALAAWRVEADRESEAAAAESHLAALLRNR